MASRLPRIGVPADVALQARAPMHMVGEKYLNAVAHGATALPLILPALGAGREMESLEDLISMDDLLDDLDGLFFPGSPSNIAPALYEPAAKAVPPFDPQRDQTTLPLLRAAIARDLPVLAVCRGFQELNVACGGTLYPAVHEVPGFMDHRDPPEWPREKQYAPVHRVRFTPGGYFATLTGVGEAQVNSLHGQGVHEVGHGLDVEARADDGLVEALRMPGKRFVVGVQWHPEWRFREQPVSVALFAAFGRAVRGK